MIISSLVKRGWLTVERLRAADDGLAITEYGMLVALIAILLIAVVTVFGSQISSWFASKTGAITTV